MADHVRKQLREAIESRLTNLTTTTSNVFGYRIHPLAVTRLPALVITTPGDDAVPLGITEPVIVERDLQVLVQGICGGTAALDDTLDTIAKEVEIALSTGLTVSSRDYLLYYRGMETSFDDGDKQIGVISMRYAVKLFNVANTPDTFA